MFHGSIAALPTPFIDGDLDVAAFTRLIRHHLDHGTDANVPTGTTGEAPALSKAEFAKIIDIAVTECAGKIPVIAGAGSYDTATAIDLSRIAIAHGVDGLLHVAGYYNRPNQEGLFQHYRTLNAALDCPILVYNIPPKTGVDILPETMARIAALSNIVGVKDSISDPARPILEHSLITRPFACLTGTDQHAVSYNAHGGQGCISVTANVAPALCKAMQKACAENQFNEALAIQLRLMPLHNTLFLEPNPSGVKYALSLMGLCQEETRLPMVPLQGATNPISKKH